MDKIDRIKELVKQLNHHRDLYYNESRPEVSDLEYDNLFDELTSLEEETGFILATSPTQTVGYEVKSELTKVKHNHPMLSLDKTKSVDDIIKFLAGKDGIVMAKMDGLTCSLRYVNGELVGAETRGNGEIGEDILHCAKTIKNIPLHINIKEEVIIDGEVIITYDDFKKINATLSENERYKHPRNLASGSIRQLDSGIAAQRNMKFIAWRFVKGYNRNSFGNRLLYLEDLGFEVVPHSNFITKFVHKDFYEEIINIIKNNCQEHGYPIDGCVFGYDDVAYGESLGATGHHLRSQIAFKFYDELYETKLVNIDWTMGKTGILTPTAVFQPVEIDGTTIERASLHNISIIKNLGLTNGCTVKIYKANQIIPQIDSCEQDGNGEIEIPSRCPICGGITAIKKDNESEVLICTNDDCSGKILGKFTHFVSRKAMNIQGISEAILETLISHNFIHNYRSIYYLSAYKDELISLEGFGEKSVLNMLKSIEDSRNVKLENFICALGIPNIGLSASKTISKACNGDWNTLWDMWNHEYDFTQLDDFGEVMANNLVGFFDEYIHDVGRLADEMNFIMPEKQEITNNPFTNKTIVVTGKLNHFTRDSINEKIASLGAKTAGSVSKKTDYLLTNESSSSSKYKKAMELNIPVISEEEFLQMIGE